MKFLTVLGLSLLVGCGVKTAAPELTPQQKMQQLLEIYPELENLTPKPCPFLFRYFAPMAACVGGIPGAKEAN